jgi:hypothetical protein
MRNVCSLAERLRKDGVDAQIDQYVAGTPQEGWPRWMLDRLDWADFLFWLFAQRRTIGASEAMKSRAKAKGWTGKDTSSHR